MLNLRQVDHLAATIGFPVSELREVAKQSREFYQRLELHDPMKPGRIREVLNVKGAMRVVQDRLSNKIFSRKLKPSPYSHGGVKGRDIKSNAQAHASSVFVFTSDISAFYPTISHFRVYQLFNKRLGCTPDVAHLLTPLCTYRHHLALGLITSPILAEQVLAPLDVRLGRACAKAKLTYTRYVDDITISGSFDLEISGFSALVAEILRQSGFRINPDKNHFGRIDDGTPITKISIKNGHPDVRREYLVELDRQLDATEQLAKGGPFEGLYFTREQIRGRINFVKWINPGRERPLARKFNSINWKTVRKEAERRGYVVARKRLVPIS
jgi:RNA-directed DNA polymerase